MSPGFPALISSPPVSYTHLRVDDDRIDQLEDVLLAADVREWVVVHGFPEIDGVQRLDDVATLFKHFAAL